MIAGAELLQRLVDQLPALVAYWDHELRLVVANPAYCRFVGHPMEQVRGRHFSQVLGEELFAANLPHLRAALAGERCVFERTTTDARGETRHTEVSYSPDVVADEVVGLFALITDVTDRVEAHRDLDEAQELAGTASWSFRPADQTSTWSRNLYRLVGQEHRPGPPDWAAYSAVVHPEDRARVAALREGAERGQAHEERYRLVVDGDVRHVHSRCRPVTGVHGDLVLVRGTIRDETDLMRQSEALEVANRRLADVIAMVGHDVRQPLGVVLGNLELSLDEATRDVGRGHVEKAYAAAHRTNRMLDDILTMVSLDSGALAVHAQHTDLGELVEGVLARQEYGAVEPRLELRSRAPVALDPFHLNQVLVNLLTNAGRYGAPPVTVTVDATATHALLRVTDAGGGVPPEFVPRLFDRFARGGESATGSRGTGLGLHIVRELVHANGGTLAYRPARPTGAEFTAAFPRRPVRTA